MAIKNNKGYICGYCHKQFINQADADKCKEEHNLIYVAISEQDLNRLITFIYTGEESLIPDNLVERLQGYLRNNFNRGIDVS